MIDRLRGARLVTITGMGGIGKTTVALAVAHRVQQDYGDGVVFVDLSPVPPQSDVTMAVANGAGVEGVASETLERLADHLAHRPVLLARRPKRFTTASSSMGGLDVRARGARVSHGGQSVVRD